jgi:A/G-specific adenine glycosylase
MTPQKFRTIVWKHYAEHGRHALPWRKSHDPYRVLVSEMMLQQTQVERVIPYFTAWMKTYPTLKRLAAAPLADVLRRWQGLGYNRRAKMLHDAAKAVVAQHGGKMPRAVAELEALPGIGPYTARAVAAFAYDEDVTFVETNLRTAVIHHFFADRSGIPDADILAVLEKAKPRWTPTRGPREWYAALMDYGAYLKRSGVRVNAKSKGYAKQSAFEGSGRQVRGAILRALATGPASKAKLLKLFPNERHAQLESQLARLLAEGMAEKVRSSYRLPS